MGHRIAAPLIGGILKSFLLELLVYPPIYQFWKWNFELKPEMSQVLGQVPELALTLNQYPQKSDTARVFYEMRSQSANRS